MTDWLDSNAPDAIEAGLALADQLVMWSISALIWLVFVPLALMTPRHKQPDDSSDACCAVDPIIVHIGGN